MAKPSSKAENVHVTVRCRPLNEKETSKKFQVVVQVDEVNGEVRVAQKSGWGRGQPKEDDRTYYYDSVFGMESRQADIFNITARPIVDSVIEGYNGTIFAYGQTGTGKTYTMEGDKHVPELRGITPNTFAHLFYHIGQCDGQVQFLVHVSYLEIYNEDVRDLLGKNPEAKLEVKERPDVGVYVKDLSTFVVKNPEQMDKLMTRGAKNRAVGVTDMNDHSSRSHTIFTITVERCELGADKKQHVRMGKLHLVDLAGSERQSKTGAEGIRLKEAAKINLSLMTLGNVISALVEGNKHVPYRTSKLTRLLQDSLGGNSKTVMIANIGPADYNMDETLNTLRYANRAKNIQNNAKINEDPKDALLREFQKEIELLRKRLEECDSSGENEGDGESPSRRKMRTPDEPRAMTPRRIAAARAKLDADRTVLHTAKDLVEGEREKMAEDLKEREDEIQKAQAEFSKLEQQLEDLTGKVIAGGVNLLEKAEEQERLLEESRKSLADRRQKEASLRKKLQQTEAERVDYEEKYVSLQDEAAAKTRKLKEGWKQLQAVNNELAEMRAEYQRENEDILDNIRQIAKEVQLQALTMDYFIPQEYQTVLHDHAEWHEDTGEWHVKGVAYAGNNVKKPLTPEEPARRFDLYEPANSILTYAGLEESLSSSSRGMKKSRSKSKSKTT